MRGFHSLIVPALALCMCSLPATADIFSDLGPAGDVYDKSNGWAVSGQTLCGEVICFSEADRFLASGSGSLSVNQIDLAVNKVPYYDNTFYASIWTDSSNQPGTQVSGAYWSESTDIAPLTCCDLVSITGITGVTLTGGQSYFMVLGPLSTSTDVNWSDNNQRVSNLELYSEDGGKTWASNGTQAIGAFDVLSTPEPGSLLLFGTVLIGVLSTYRRKSNR